MAKVMFFIETIPQIGISVGDIEQILESSYFKRYSLQVGAVNA